MIKVRSKTIFQDTATETHLNHGRSLAEICHIIYPSVSHKSLFVSINGYRIYDGDFARVKPKQNTHINITLVGQGDNAGAIFTIIALAFSPVISPMIAGKLFGVGASALTHTQLAVGSIIYGVGTLYATQTFFGRKIPKSDVGNKSKLARIRGNNNTNAFGRVSPVVFGTTKMQPLHFANPYTEQVGDDMYYRMLLLVGDSPVNIRDIRINDVELSKYDSVQHEILNGYSNDTKPTLYTNTVKTKSVGHVLDTSWTTVATEECEEFEINIAFEQGLVRFDGNDPKTQSVGVNWQYRKRGDANWSIQYRQYFSDDKQHFINRVLRRDKMPKGIYDIRIQRINKESDSAKIRDRAKITLIKSVVYESPILDEQIGKMAFISMRIKATGQLTGSIGAVTCMVDSLMPKFTNAGYEYPADDKAQHATNVANFTGDNPARAYLHVLRLRETPTPERKINHAVLKSWHDYCAGKHTCNGVVEDSVNIRKLLNDIALTGWASFGYVDNKYGVVRNDKQPMVSQAITPANSWEFNTTRSFQDMHDAMKIIWLSPARGYKREETIIYATGKDITNAKKIGEMELDYTQNYDEAFKLGRIALAIEQLQPNTHVWKMDIQAFSFKMGDRVVIAHDSIKTTELTCVATQITRDANNKVSAITISEKFTPKDGKSYKVGWVYIGDYITHDCTIADTVVTLTTPTNNAPELQNPILIHEVGTTRYDAVVREITRHQNMQCTIKAVNYDENIYTTGTIPAYKPVIIQNEQQQIAVPNTPVIRRIVSDETALRQMADGTIVSRIQIYYAPSDDADIILPDKVEVGYKPQTESTYKTILGDFSNGNIEIPAVIAKEVYDIKLRAIANNIASDWSPAQKHTVIGKTDPPPPPSDLRYANNTLYWDLSPRPLDLAGFALRYNYNGSSDWNQGVPLNTGGVVISSPYDIQNLFYVDVVVMVRSVDTTGNLSTTWESVSVPYAGADVQNPVLILDFKDQWGKNRYNTLTNLKVVGNTLVADQQDGALAYKPCEYYAVFQLPDSAVGRDVVLSYDMTGQHHIEIGNKDPFYNGGADTIAYDGGNDADGYKQTFRTMPLRFVGTKDLNLIKVTFPKQNTQSEIKKLRFYIDYAEIREMFTGLTIAVGGTKLNPTKSFTVYKGIIATAQNTKSIDITYDIPNDGTPPIIKAFDKDGNPATTIATIELIGY